MVTNTNSLPAATVEDYLKVLTSVQKTLNWLGHELDPDGGPTSAEHTRWLVSVVLAEEDILAVIPLTTTAETGLAC